MKRRTQTPNLVRARVVLRWPNEAPTRLHGGSRRSRHYHHRSFSSQTLLRIQTGRRKRLSFCVTPLRHRPRKAELEGGFQRRFNFIDIETPSRGASVDEHPRRCQASFEVLQLSRSAQKHEPLHNLLRHHGPRARSLQALLAREFPLAHPSPSWVPPKMRFFPLSTLSQAM